MALRPVAETPGMRIGQRQEAAPQPWADSGCGASADGDSGTRVPGHRLDPRPVSYQRPDPKHSTSPRYAFVSSCLMGMTGIQFMNLNELVHTEHVGQL